MRFGSVCSGIEAASVAWAALGWNAAFFSEIEPFPCAVLAERFPDVPNFGDMTRFQEWPDAAIDLLCGGTPCQSFSVAGLRGGLADPRGNLMLTFGAIAQRYRPRWLVWENVPGVLSSNGGRDFGSFLGLLGQLGYGFAYRVLDAQYAGLAQRRKRVFVVGCLGDWRRAAAVLFERHSLSGHPAPSREAREGVAYGFASGAVDGIAKPLGAHALDKGRGTDLDNTTYVAFDTTQITSAANYSNPQPGDPCHPIAATAHPPAVAFAQNSRDELREMPYVGALAAEPGMKQTSYLRQGAAVRRLTTRECERLQGFPDDWTAITYRGKPAADGPRYKAIGNSWAVPVVAWIGRRIEMVEAISKQELAA